MTGTLDENHQFAQQSSSDYTIDFYLFTISQYSIYFGYMVQIKVQFGVGIEIEIGVEVEVVGIEADIEHDIEIVVDLLQFVLVVVVKKEGLAYNDIEEFESYLLAVLVVMLLMLDVG